MKIKSLISIVLFFGLVVNFALTPSLSAQEQEEEKKAQESKPVIIPPQVKSAIQLGIETGQTRTDIPFTIIKYYYLPAQQNVHITFLFKVKNADLGYRPIAKALEDLEKQQEETPPSESESQPSTLQANSFVFLQFNSLNNGEPGEVVKEVYIPIKEQIESSSYEPDKEEIYSTGYPLPPGDYLLSMAITSSDLTLIGTQHIEFSLPDSMSFTKELGTTPILFVKGIEQMTEPEMRAEVHKGYFTYSILKINPNIENILSVGENFDIFFFIFGARPALNGKFNIEINYEVLKDDKKVIRYATTPYDAPVISQPLPAQRTVIINPGTKEEKKETRELEAGQYTFFVKITDKESGNSVEKRIDFEVK